MNSINQGAGKTVSVLTPTYNRASQLKDLWKSLCLQTSSSFVWVIVDDGSMDNTVEVVQEFIADGKVEIVFLQKSNGGKHTALNFGIQEIQTPLTFIVDSDDTLTPDAIEKIINIFDDYKVDLEVCGFSFLRKFPNGKINGKLFPRDYWKETYINARINTDDIMSDKAEIYKTSCLKEFIFPEYKNEKFLGEDLVWIRMARKYKMLHINQAIYIGYYQVDGLTSNRRKHNLLSPNGCTDRAKEFLYTDIKLKYRIKGALQYLIYGRIAGRKLVDLYRNAPSKILCMVLSPVASIIRIFWLKKYLR